MNTATKRQHPQPPRDRGRRVPGGTGRTHPGDEFDLGKRTAMLIHEELARERIREMRRHSAARRGVRRARYARRWARVATWADGRARHYAP